MLADGVEIWICRLLGCHCRCAPGYIPLEHFDTSAKARSVCICRIAAGIFEYCLSNLEMKSAINAQDADRAEPRASATKFLYLISLTSPAFVLLLVLLHGAVRRDTGQLVYGLPSLVLTFPVNRSC